MSSGSLKSRAYATDKPTMHAFLFIFTLLTMIIAPVFIPFLRRPTPFR